MPSRGAGGSRAGRTASLADHGHETDGEADFALERAIRAFFEQHKVLQNHALWRDELSAHSQLIREGFRHLRRRRREEDPVERSFLRPASVTVASANEDV